MFFKKKIDQTSKNEASQADFKSDQILYVAKSKYARAENELRSSLYPQLKRICEQTKTKIKNIKIKTKVGEYDQEAFQLITGLINQLSRKLSLAPIEIYLLELELDKNKVRIHAHSVQSESIGPLIGKKFNTGFGLWGVYEANGIQLQAHFEIDQYRQYISAAKSRNNMRGTHV